MENKNREILMQLLTDMQDFAKMKDIKCEPIYLLGGSGCIIGNYLKRATTDIDFVDIGYKASSGRLFKLLESFDMLDLYVCSNAEGFQNRATRLDEFDRLEIYVLSPEDIIVSKIGRYQPKDIEDISELMGLADIKILMDLIDNVLARKDFSEIAKKHFENNVKLFRERFDV